MLGDRYALLLARLAVAALFIFAAVGKVSAPDAFIAGLAQGGVPYAQIAGWAGIVVEGLAATILVTGYGSRLAALALIVFTMLATLIAHRFWEAPPEMLDLQRIQFLKNLAICGGLLGLMVLGERGTLRSFERGWVEPKR
ncbi:MAG: DoxX family protein [Geminicoccaceae bacterium]